MFEWNPTGTVNYILIKKWFRKKLSYLYYIFPRYLIKTKLLVNILTFVKNTVKA